MIPELLEQFKHLKNQKELAKTYSNLIKKIDIFNYSNYQIFEFCNIFGITLDFFDKFEFYALKNSQFSELLIKYAVQENLIKPSLENFNIIVQSKHNFDTSYKDFLNDMLRLTRDISDSHNNKNPKPSIWMQYLKQSSLVNNNTKDIIAKSTRVFRDLGNNRSLGRWVYNDQPLPTGS